MQALFLDSSLLYRPDYPKPQPGEHEALIRLRVAGSCATDLELVKGYAGFSGIPGHEFVGIVEAVGHPRHQQWLNRRVVGSINIGCGDCDACRQSGPAHCQQRKVLGIRGKDGVFADYFTLPIDNLYALSDQLDDETAVFIEPLAAAMRVVEQLQAISVTKVAVLGPGRLGLLIAKVLSIHGYGVDVLGRSSASLVLPNQWQLNTAMLDEDGDGQYQCVIDASGSASGSASGFRQALRILAARGTLILKSTFSDLEPVDLSKIVIQELNVIGSRCGPFADTLAMLQRHALPLTDLIDGRYPLEEGGNAFRQAAQAGVRKILLYP